ncbi:DUF4019 domain-containing protein [Desulfonatronum sp. SC1]|uniref:DUF4019 domain-containing protein n=1 Tax=Desulfonatronum sp. SC1 TaxID=2109626 RepID=UPI000D308569|nr:DUF4019 domain-containing protein [Desulfonatronum sp. SC1]PTN37739.1 hypothetical protein C6366_05730 [Desulfonatronum sp. SC1]
MKLSIISFVAFLLITAMVGTLQSASYSGDAQHESDAVSVAIIFLELIDDEQYRSSWDLTAPIFRNEVSRSNWVDMLMTVRPSLGEVVAREVKAVDIPTSRQGVPDGEYGTITFNTSYSNMAEAVETVAMVRIGMEWLVAGYFIQ